ncbi:hypothetical protein ANN_20152 [Periplaneta americana]|uniref:Reverse transcriptase domain-containing protein n=1 Tax=Periplaneta americana TaxID=6978 RepID=A0ABQ8SC33_PERAM|nr:hypothetical protein ANN_20152 [Periplaneta americana]
MSPGSRIFFYPAFAQILRENPEKPQPEHGRGYIGGRSIKCIRFAVGKALLAEEVTILTDMLLELNDSCEQYGMKINANKTKNMVIGRKLKKNQSNGNEILRRTAGYTLLDRKRNEEILEQLEVESVEEKISRYKFNWLDHVRRMENSRIPKIMMQYKPRGHRRPGRPLRRLLDGAETGL